MKKFLGAMFMNKKGFLALFLVVAVTLSVTFVGCKSSVEEGESIGKVSAKQWEESLSFNFETADSYTMSDISGSTYDVNQAQEYGEYWLTTSTTYVDVKNSKAYMISETKEYNFSTQEVESEGIYVNYLFLQDGVYYSAEKTGTGQWDIDIMSKADYLYEIELEYNVVSMRTMGFIAMKDEFNYDKDFKAYVMAGPVELRLQFLSGGGYGIYEKISSTEMWERKVYSINKTTVDIPQEVLTAVEDFNSAN